MKDLGMMHYFLGLEVWKFPDEIFLSQGNMLLKYLIYLGFCIASYEHFDVTNLKFLKDNSLDTVDVILCRHIIGSLMCLKDNQPYICFAIKTMSQDMVEPVHVYLVATKHVMRYLKGTLDYGLRYAVDGEIKLHGYTY